MNIRTLNSNTSTAQKLQFHNKDCLNTMFLDAISLTAALFNALHQLIHRKSFYQRRYVSKYSHTSCIHVCFVHIGRPHVQRCIMSIFIGKYKTSFCATDNADASLREFLRRLRVTSALEGGRAPRESKRHSKTFSIRPTTLDERKPPFKESNDTLSAKSAEERRFDQFSELFSEATATDMKQRLQRLRHW